jgi:ATP-dependent RNA helicase DDX31/DBP7
MCFVSTTASADFLHALLPRAKLPARGAAGSLAHVLPGERIHKLHGNMAQGDRLASLAAFRANGGLLLCTDVAARGLDLPAVSWVLQYDAPTEISEYVHRVGRTARLGQRGRSLLFLLLSELSYVDVLRERGVELQETNLISYLRVFLPQLQEPAGLRAQKDRSPYLSYMDNAMRDLQLSFERLVVGDEEMTKLAKHAFKSYVRAYATHGRASKAAFHVKLLHLGHVAKSFALREAPSKIKLLQQDKQDFKQKRAKDSSRETDTREELRSQQRDRHNEFDDGATSRKKQRK